MQTRTIAILGLAAALLGCAARPAVTTQNTVVDEPWHLLAYRPEAFAGTWRLTSHFVSVPGATTDREVDLEIVLRLVPAGAAGAFELFYASLAITGHEGKQPFDLRRSDAELGAAPVSTLSIDAHGAGTGAHPVVDTAMFLIPPTPTESVEVGEVWTASRSVPTSDDHPDITVEIEYRLASVAACAAPLTGTCARITSTADTGERTLESPTGEARIRYTLEGDSELQLDGVLSRARMRMSIRGGVAGAEFDLDGEMTYQWTPAAASQAATSGLSPR